MDELTLRIKTLQEEIIESINKSQLHPAIVMLALNGIQGELNKQLVSQGENQNGTNSSESNT